MPFRHIIGHRKLLALLSRSVATDRLPPSLIFSGPSGIGKRLAALSTAQALNCLSPEPATSQSGEPLEHDACGACSACTRITRGVHPDVLVLEPNDKGNIRIDAARDLVDRAGYRPFEGRRRVAIVDQAEALEPGAQNALLKLLEEPPAGSAFLLVTAYPDQLLPTVRSRCPQLRFRPLSVEEVAYALLAQGRSAAEASAVAALADGSIGHAMASAAGDLVDARGVAMNVLADLASHDDVRRRMEQAKILAGTGTTDREQLGVQLRAMASLLRDVGALEAGADRGVLANPDLASRLDRLRPGFAGERGRRAFQAVDRALSALDRYANSKLVADWLVLQL